MAYKHLGKKASALKTPRKMVHKHEVKEYIKHLSKKGLKH